MSDNNELQNKMNALNALLEQAVLLGGTDGYFEGLLTGLKAATYIIEGKDISDWEHLSQKEQVEKCLISVLRQQKGMWMKLWMQKKQSWMRLI